MSKNTFRLKKTVKFTHISYLSYLLNKLMADK